jgi:hypothetical protein
MEFVYYTIAGIVLYLGSDWILNRMEISRGKRFEHRTGIFFVIILVLAVVTFRLIEYLTSK